MSDEIIFKGRVIRCTYNSDNYKVYAIDVDRNKYPNIKFTKYGNATITGNLHTLGEGIEYEIRAIEEQSKYGYGYKVLNIKRDKPNTSLDMQMFLSEILTPKQAQTLYEVYPDIVDRVMQNNLDDIDLNKLNGIKEFTFNIIKEKIIENFVLVELVSEFQGMLSLSMIKKLYEKYTSVQKIRNELKNNPYKCLCGLARVGFKTADSLLLEIDRVSKENVSKGQKPIVKFEFDLKTSQQRCLACILFLLEENESNGHTKMNLVELKKQCEKLVPACSHHFTNVIKHEDIYYNKEKLDVALKSTYDIELYIANRIKEGLKINTVWDCDYEKYRSVNGIELTDEQNQVLEKICKYNIVMLNGSAGCVDCDTEFFNGSGWKKISDYKEGDMVLQYNEDGTANLVYPINYIKQSQKQLWHFETKYGLDQCLSDNHTVVYITSRGNIKRRTFKDICNIHNSCGFKGKFITSFKYNGKGIDLSDNIIRLMIAIFADGSFYSDYDKRYKCYNRVRFHLKKQRKKERLEEILNNLNIKYDKKESFAYGYHDYYFDAPFRCKHYPKEWYNCSEEQLNIIADEVMNWDGEYKKQNRYSTTNKNDADFIQWVFTSLGYRTSILINDRTGNMYKTCGKTYKRKSKEYSVSYTNRNLISMCTDKRKNSTMTKIEPYKTIDGYEYCFTVPSHMLVLRRNNKIFVTGNCGKSATTVAVIKLLNDNNKSFRLFAPTGRAAKVLSEYTKYEATTIHRGLGYIPPDEWTYNKDNKLTCDVLIIDEFSMADIFLFKKVLDAIDFNVTKLLLVGDNAQLPSVSCGNLLHDFMKSEIIPTTTLNKVFRYGEGGLMKVATDVRNCKQYINKNNMEQCTFYGANKDYAFINVDQSKIIKQTVALYQKLLSQGYKPEDIQVLTSYNKGEYGSVVINNHLQKIANCNYGTTGLKYGETTYYEGDLVIQTINNYKAKIYVDDEWCFGADHSDETFIANGEIGKIFKIGMHDMIIDFDGTKIKYSRDDLQGIKLGYSISVHKSQGGSAKVVILLTPQAHTYMLNSNLIYVGLTRMKEKCFHLGNVDTVNIAINKKENFNRQTFMKELLLNNF